jgi:hypothetical protein
MSGNFIECVRTFDETLQKLVCNRTRTFDEFEQTFVPRRVEKSVARFIVCQDHGWLIYDLLGYVLTGGELQPVYAEDAATFSAADDELDDEIYVSRFDVWFRGCCKGMQISNWCRFPIEDETIAPHFDPTSVHFTKTETLCDSPLTLSQRNVSVQTALYVVLGNFDCTDELSRAIERIDSCLLDYVVAHAELYNSDNDDIGRPEIDRMCAETNDYLKDASAECFELFSQLCAAPFYLAHADKFELGLAPYSISKRFSAASAMMFFLDYPADAQAKETARRAEEQARADRAARERIDAENAHKLLAKRVRSSATATLLRELMN